MDISITITETCTQQLLTLRRISTGDWPAPDWQQARERLGKIKEQLLRMLGLLAIRVDALPRSPQWPDYFGQTYMVLAQACFEALIAENEALFNDVFKPLFHVALAASERVRKGLQAADPDIQFLLSTDSIDTLLLLSGYALLFSRMDNKQYWALVQRCWDGYFSQHPQPQEVAEFLCIFRDLRISRGGMRNRLIWDHWRTAFEQQLVRRHLLGDRQMLSRFWQGTRPSHPDAIIRTIIRGSYPGHLPHDPQDVFLAEYVIKRPEAKQASIPRITQEFIDALNRQQPRRNKRRGQPRSRPARGQP